MTLSRVQTGVTQHYSCCIALTLHYAASKGGNWQCREHSIQMRVRAPDPVVRVECRREHVALQVASAACILIHNLIMKTAPKKTLVANGNV
jgi:hypothetical protein